MNHETELRREAGRLITRRWFFRDCGLGLGSMALANLLLENRVFAASPTVKASGPLVPKQPPFPAKAKRIIYLFQAGAPSQLDLFDFKPTLVKYDGKPVPAEVVKDQVYAFIKPDAALFASKFKFARHGQCGAEISEMLPHLATVVDDIAIIKSMNTHAFNHAPAQILMNTGSTQFGRPSMGAWATYGLGSESQNLPGFVVLSSAGGTSGGSSNWGCGFLPTLYQGVPFRRTGDPILSLANPPGITPAIQRKSLDLLKQLNSQHLNDVGDPEIATRINSFEMAFRMQTSAPELMDIS
ncbi:MAG: DUF1501 domain-containing protein, partial [Verrucomicrobiota bacterium]